MNQQEQMQLIVEAAGECWHIRGDRKTKIGGEMSCIRCGKFSPSNEEINPSPHSLDDLFRLVKALNYHCEIDVDGEGQTQVSVHSNNLLSIRPAGQSLEGLQLADALRSALVKAIEGRNTK
jgi:hypothetical protein